MGQTRCSYCGKENASEADFCVACGTALKAASTANAPPEAETSGADPRIRRGALWLGGGLLVTVISYSAAGPGGTYIITWGAVAYGAYLLFLGLTRRSPTPASADEARDLLEVAGHLESVDRAGAIAKYEEIVNSFPGTPAAREARQTLEMLRAQQQTPAS
jgi:zinc-ribbon domain